MDKFVFKKPENIIKLDICEKIYEFNVSPTNYDFVKKLGALTRELENVMQTIGAMPRDKIIDLEKTFDLIKEKEQKVIDILLPGKWDELFTLAGTDLMNMAELITFIAGHVKKAGVAAKTKEIAAEVPEDAREV